MKRIVWSAFGFIVLSIFLTAFVFLSDKALASDPLGYNIYVDDNALPGWYNATHVRSITEAMTNASNGQSIFIYSGTYTGSTINVNKIVDICGESPTTTIVNGTSNGGVFWLNPNHNGNRISNLTIRHKTAGDYYAYSGIDIDNQQVYIYNCIFDHCYVGIDLQFWSHYIYVYNCNFSSCLSDGVGVALYASVDE